jgi:hypothetical protein
MNQYIINELDIEHLWNLLKTDYPIAGGELVYRIRSHPYQSKLDKVLDKIWQYFLDNDCQVHISPISGEKYYWISGTFSVSGLMRLVEELRQAGEP